MYKNFFLNLSSNMLDFLFLLQQSPYNTTIVSNMVKKIEDVKICVLDYILIWYTKIGYKMKIMI